MLLITLGASLLGNTLAGKGAIVKRQGWGVIRTGDSAMEENKNKIEETR